MKHKSLKKHVKEERKVAKEYGKLMKEDKKVAKHPHILEKVSKKYEKEEKHEHKKKDPKPVKPAIKKAMQHPDVLGAGAKKRKHLHGKDKVEVVMKEFKRHTLNSGSGHKVTNPKQAIAIALSEARKAGEHIKKKRK